MKEHNNERCRQNTGGRGRTEGRGRFILAGMKKNQGDIPGESHKGIPDERAAEKLYARFIKAGLTPYTKRRFRGIIYGFYRQNARDYLPWRSTDDPYRIIVSEIMLQQTQVERVLRIYPLLIKKYPDFQSLARAPLRSLYAVWQGMGYNRRALALRKIAGLVIQSPYYGSLPSAIEELMRLPGVGRTTACAIRVFAFQQPEVFIETNIRRVFIHFFFRNEKTVSDADILPLVGKTLDVKDPRDWYYALMDYGSALRKLTENPNRKSSRYTRQKPFAGSNRQVRGEILRLVMKQSAMSRASIIRRVNASEMKVMRALSELQAEGFIKNIGNRYYMA